MRFKTFVKNQRQFLLNAHTLITNELREARIEDFFQKIKQFLPDFYFLKFKRSLMRGNGNAFFLEGIPLYFFIIIFSDFS